MEEIELIIGDNSSIYQFSSKQVTLLDDRWSGSWAISKSIGGESILSGNLIKNDDIFNDDSIENEEFRKTYKIFETTEKEIVEFNEDIINHGSCIVTGRMFTVGTDDDGNKVNIPEINRYITITLKSIFTKYTRSEMVKTDENGAFSFDFNIGATVKTKANSVFVFQLMPLESEQLEVGDYFLSVEVKQRNDINDDIIFRREVLQAKLRMSIQGVLPPYN